MVGGMPQEQFQSQRDQFIEEAGYEPKRSGDGSYFPESFSPLHKFNPNMLPMTYFGIRMLGELLEKQPDRWIVPPLGTASGMNGDRVTLLETMPGAFLKAIGVIHKCYKTAQDATKRREVILRALEGRIGSPIPAALRMGCLANDDCLDSVIAAIAAATWAQDPDSFRHPSDEELALAKLEGWIYVPQSPE